MGGTITLQRRYPNSRPEDITDAYMRGFLFGRAFEKSEQDEPTSVVFEITNIEYAKVVRCRDCEHYEDHYTDFAFYDAPVCWHFEKESDYPAMVEPDGYCAWGVRRDA